MSSSASQIIISMLRNWDKNLIPEDPAYSTPDVSNFFFSGRYVRDTMCNSIFFFQLFRVHFHTIKTGTLTPEIVFFNFFPFFSGYIVPGLRAKFLLKNDFKNHKWTWNFFLNIFCNHLYRLYVYFKVKIK